LFAGRVIDSLSANTVITTACSFLLPGGVNFQSPGASFQSYEQA
jgi:hypothetical protein